MDVDAVIFGGGAAGLWILDDLLRRGLRVVLLEAAALGSGQSIASQGIIHGGLKYTLSGKLTGSAARIREMPLIWRDCLSGRRLPDLSGVRLRSDFCYLWRTGSARSRLGMIGARFGLSVKPEEVPLDRRPAVLKTCPGTVARLAEQVVSPGDLIARLSEPSRRSVLRIDVGHGLQFDVDAPGVVRAVRLRNPQSQDRLELRPRHVIFSAGAGNGRLRRLVGLGSEKMQRRPLHMVTLRGKLPWLNGHCVDGGRTRVTITSDTDSSGRVIWQVGGQIAEDGVEMDALQLLRHCRGELEAVLPGFEASGVEATAYRVDRAERSTRFRRRPDDVQVLREGNVITAWPTKLALVPRLPTIVMELLDTGETTGGGLPAIPERWPRPEVALPPWETSTAWRRLYCLDDGSAQAA